VCAPLSIAGWLTSKWWLFFFRNIFNEHTNPTTQAKGNFSGALVLLPCLFSNLASASCAGRRGVWVETWARALNAHTTTMKPLNQQLLNFRRHHFVRLVFPSKAACFSHFSWPLYIIFGLLECWTRIDNPLYNPPTMNSRKYSILFRSLNISSKRRKDK
jgi:hypothetical protein